MTRERVAHFLSRFGGSSNNGRGPNKPRIVKVDGRPVVVIGLGETSKRLGISKRVLRLYHDKGVLPHNYWLDDRGRRWYPLQFVEALVPAIGRPEGTARKRYSHQDLLARVQQVVERTPDLIVFAEGEADGKRAASNTGGLQDRRT